MTREELDAFRESKGIILEKLREAQALLRSRPDAAIRRLDDARLLTSQLKAIARTYLRRTRRR